MSGRVVVVGGGIIGITSAWYLVRRGWQVTVIDRGKIGTACSGGNCGLVCPSHVLPLTEPGAFKEALKALVDTRSAFRIKPRLDPSLWSWLWNFARRCNHKKMVQSAYAIQALLTSSMQEYQTLVEQEQIQCEWQEKGLLFAYHSQASLDAFESTNRLLSESFNEPARRLNKDETLELEPALKDSVAGSWYYEHDAHLRPDKLITSLRKRLAEAGAEFVEECEFQSIVGESSRARAIATSQGDFDAEHFLFAGGAWMPLLQDHLGCKIPIQPGKGYSITMPRPAVCPSIPIIFPEHRVVVTPMQSGYRLGSIMEFAGYDETIRPERLELLRFGARAYLREPLCEPELETWYGWRPMTYDSVPIIDRSPRWKNGWVACGHNMLGLSMAPSTGRLVAELISAETPHLSVDPYRLERFQ